MQKRFGDKQHGAFFFSEAGATDLIIRQKVATDSPLPSGNAIAAMTLIELDQADEAAQTFGVFVQQIQSNGEGMSSMVEAAIACLRHSGPFTVSGKADAKPRSSAFTTGSGRGRRVDPGGLG